MSLAALGSIRRISFRSVSYEQYLTEAGLPDGILTCQNPTFGICFESLAMKHFNLFNGHLVHISKPLMHFMAVWYILWSFGQFYKGKSGNP
jgi:hypothetical protein